MTEEKKYDITQEELSRYLQVEGLIQKVPFEKQIREKFPKKEEFDEYIKEPVYPPVGELDRSDIPAVCGFCEHYTMGTTHFLSMTCILFPKWPITRSFFSYCEKFEWNLTQIDKLTKTERL